MRSESGSPATRTAYPLERLRADFPILRTSMRGKPLAYLDNGATSLKPQVVVDAEVEYLTRISANIHRGVYQLSEEATLRFDAARETIRAFINAGDDSELIFTKGATEGSNIVAFGWGRKHLGSGDTILLTEMEHHANLIPWQQVAQTTGAKLEFIPLGPGGTVSVPDVDAAITPSVKVVAITGMSNVTGYRPPVKEIAEIAHSRNAILVVDGAQLVSHHSVDVQALGCDFLTFSSHKMCGPTGVGGLYGRKDLLEETDPLLYGGDMIVRVRRDTSTFKGAPDKFETGTPNISGVLAFGRAIEYLREIGMDEIAAHERTLLDYGHRIIGELPGVELQGPRDADVNSGGIISFNVGDLHPHDVGAVLDGEGIAVRTGFHCAQPFMQFLGVPGTVRASFYLYNTTGEIDRLAVGIRKAQEVFS